MNAPEGDRSHVAYICAEVFSTQCITSKCNAMLCMLYDWISNEEWSRNMAFIRNPDPEPSYSTDVIDRLANLFAPFLSLRFVSATCA